MYPLFSIIMFRYSLQIETGGIVKAHRGDVTVSVYTYRPFCEKDFAFCESNVHLPIILAWSAFANVKQMVAITDDVPDNPDIFVFEWNRVSLCERHECFQDCTPCSYVSSVLSTPLTLWICVYMRIYGIIGPFGTCECLPNAKRRCLWYYDDDLSRSESLPGKHIFSSMRLWGYRFFFFSAHKTTLQNKNNATDRWC